MEEKQMSQIELGYSVESHVDATAPPQRIIFRWLKIDTAGGLNILYASEGEPTDDNIESFIDKLGYPVSAVPMVPGRDSPLDVRCTEDCWMVFYLDGDWNWQFSNKPGLNSGFSTKKNFGPKYGNLVHVMNNGDRLHGRLDRDGCRLLYFRAKCGNVHFQDGFNLHVDLVLQLGKSTTLIIDPIIRNP
jgi:hypothetical protein